MPLPYNGHTIANNAARLQLMKHLRNSSLNNVRNAGSRKSPLLRLNNGLEIPAFGLGTSTQKLDSGNVVQAVKDAIDLGYRHFDCSWTYENEKDVGQGIWEKIEEGVIKREDVFVVGKLWSTFYRPDRVELGCRQTLKNLGLEYVDLFVIHYPTSGVSGKMAFANIDICDTWRGMEQLVRKGLVRAIGVSNFKCDQINRLISRCSIPPAVNQVEIHPYLSNRKLVEFCMARGIRVTACSPLHDPEKGFLEKPSLLQDPVLLEIAERYNRTVTQVILRWVFQRGVVVVPKTVKKHELQEYFHIFNFHLSDEDTARIFNLNRNQRLNKFLN